MSLLGFFRGDKANFVKNVNSDFSRTKLVFHAEQAHVRYALCADAVQERLEVLLFVAKSLDRIELRSLPSRVDAETDTDQRRYNQRDCDPKGGDRRRQ